MDVNPGILERVQTWYEQQCDGDWEHSFGLNIETLDNPGWWVTVDLRETRWSSLHLERKVIQRNELDWIQFEVTNEKFIGCGGSGNLVEILEVFLKTCQ